MTFFDPIYYLIFYSIFFLFLNNRLKKKKILQSYSGERHQTYTNVSQPLTGGIYFVIPIFLLFKSTENFFSIFIILIFILGILSDTKILESAKKRFIIQLLLILFFVFLQELEVTPTKIDFIDKILTNTFLSYFFTVFCLIVLINGSNFIDGLNGLLVGYITIILFILYQNDYFINSNINTKIIFVIFIFIFLLNLFNQLFLGDNGSYLLSFFIGFLLIDFYRIAENISPYFIIMLLWYPSFENLFSIVRKVIQKNSPLKPDNQHLHHLLYFYLKKQFRLGQLLSNILSSLIINTFNVSVLFIASIKPNMTNFQLVFIFSSINLYLLSYFFLKKYFNQLNFKKKL